MIRVLFFISLLVYGLFAGFQFSVIFIELALKTAPASNYVIVEQVKHTNLFVLAQTLSIAKIAAALILLWLIRTKRSLPLYLIIAGLAATLISLVINLSINVPIDTAQMVWDPQNPPANWQEMRDQWQMAHLIRTIIDLLGFAVVILAALKFKNK